jgi:hypothetical protein
VGGKREEIEKMEWMNSEGGGEGYFGIIPRTFKAEAINSALR